MGKAGNLWAKKARAELMEKLGGACAWCGLSDPEELTFDCIIPQGDKHHRGSPQDRMCFYRKQHFDRGNVQILCAKCNSKKGDSITETNPPEMNWQHVGDFATNQNPF